jgi:DNA-binding transcriptional LysR family regulator
MFGGRHVTPLATAFLTAHPSVKVDLVLADRNLDLIEQRLDVAVRIGSLPESGLVARRVGTVHRMIVASPTYLAARGTPARPADLARHDVVFTASHPTPPEWRFRDGARERAVRLTPRLTVSHVEAAVSAAAQGHGIAAAFSYQVDDELRDGRLVRLLPRFERPPLPVQLVVPSARLMPMRVRLFLDHAASHLGRLPVIRPERWRSDRLQP